MNPSDSFHDPSFRSGGSTERRHSREAKFAALCRDAATSGRWRENDAPRRLSSRNYWPLGVVAAVALFIAGTAALILVSARTQTDLVSPDYYERELRYQEDLNRRARTLALQGRVRVAYDAAQRRLTLALPAEHAGRQVEGGIHLYRPAAAGQDRRIRLDLDAQGRQAVDTGALSAGLWRVRVTWRVGNEDFAFDDKVVIGQSGPS